MPDVLETGEDGARLDAGPGSARGAEQLVVREPAKEKVIDRVPDEIDHLAPPEFISRDAENVQEIVNVVDQKHVVHNAQKEHGRAICHQAHAPRLHREHSIGGRLSQ